LETIAFDFLRATAEDKPGTPPNLRTGIKLDPTALEKYVGSYVLVPVVSTFTITREEDRLYAQITGQPRVRIYPESENKFFYKAVNAQIDFESDDEGNVKRLVLHQNGTDLSAGRLKLPAKEDSPLEGD
jgi:hypothetical protein